MANENGAPGNNGQVDEGKKQEQRPTSARLNSETVRYLAGQRGAEQDKSRPVNWG